METLTYVSIEELGLSMKLYNRFKRAGINDAGGIQHYDYTKLTKGELIELLQEFANYRDDSTNHVEDCGASDALYSRMKKLGIETIQGCEKVGYNKFQKAELVELLENYADYDSYNM